MVRNDPRWERGKRWRALQRGEGASTRMEAAATAAIKAAMAQGIDDPDVIRAASRKAAIAQRVFEDAWCALSLTEGALEWRPLELSRLVADATAAGLVTEGFGL